MKVATPFLIWNLITLFKLFLIDLPLILNTATAFELSDITLPVALSTTFAVKTIVSYCLADDGTAVTVTLAFLNERLTIPFLAVLLALNPVVPP